MKNCIYIFLALLFFPFVEMKAQMSDSQVVEYARKAVSQGESQAEIGKELLARGVSMQQIERLKSKYQNEVSDKNNKGLDAQKDAKDKNKLSGLRVQNGETAPRDTTEKEEEEYEKEIFGHDIFSGKDLTFAPQMNIATPANYILGPGDEVVLDIYGASQYNGTFVVSPDGSITIPNEGPVNVAGLTVSQAQARVQRAIGGHYQGSKIKIGVGQTRTIVVNVMGEVKTPGTYTLSAFATVFNALYLAGGINEIGTLRSIKVVRNGRVITKVDVYEYILTGRLAGNVLLKDNDVIIVGAYDNIVSIEGKIKRPMYYEMKDGESLQSLINYAGGFTGDAYNKQVRVERKTNDGLTVSTVDEMNYQTFQMKDGDIAVVSAAIDRYKNTVTVNGAVFYPGKYKLDGQVNSVRTLVQQAGGLIEQAETARAVIHRVKADRTLQTYSVNLQDIMNGNAPDMILQNEDELYIASKEELFKGHVVSIYGDVFHPGIFQFSEGETVEDLITEAGGLKECASLQNIEVARRVVNAEESNGGINMATIYTLTLDNGLAIDGDKGLKLKPFDIVTIHRSPDYQIQKTVSVSGEVKYAGNYVIANKGERMSDIIKRAGGFAPGAYTGGIQLIRKFTEEEQKLKQLKLEVAKTEADSIDAITQLSKKTYSVGVDAEKLLANPGCSSDIVLQEGDSIIVPQMNNVVKISGEVMFPNTVAYQKGKGINYYLKQAGGVSKEGKKRLTYVLYPNGQVDNIYDAKIVPGCEVIVPKKPEKKKTDTALISVILAIATTMATIGSVLITAIGK